MIEHELDGTGCWCGPSEDFVECDDNNGALHQHHVITHHNERGEDLFVIWDDNGVPTCPDCDLVLDAFIPDPAMWRGWANAQVLPNVNRSFGVWMKKVGHGLEITVAFGASQLYATLSGERRLKSVGERTAAMAPAMIAELEEHLRAHE